MGSFERMIAILTEHFAGKWPLWLSPKQVMVVPISAGSYEYAEQVKQAFHQAKFFVEADTRDLTMQKKVREAQLSQFNYILVVGEKPIADMVALLTEERDERKLEGSL